MANLSQVSTKKFIPGTRVERDGVYRIKDKEWASDRDRLYGIRGEDCMPDYTEIVGDALLVTLYRRDKWNCILFGDPEDKRLKSIARTLMQDGRYESKRIRIESTEDTHSVHLCEPPDCEDSQEYKDAWWVDRDLERAVEYLLAED